MGNYKDRRLTYFEHIMRKVMIAFRKFLHKSNICKKRKRKTKKNMRSTAYGIHHFGDRNMYETVRDDYGQ